MKQLIDYDEFSQDAHIRSYAFKRVNEGVMMGHYSYFSGLLDTFFLPSYKNVHFEMQCLCETANLFRVNPEEEKNTLF